MIRALLIFILIAGSALAESGKPSPPAVVVMLDVNDTMLREVDFEEHVGKPGVQVITFKSDPARASRAGVGINHSRAATGGQIESALGLRPGMEPFFERLSPLVAAGKVRIVLTSLGEPARTEAIRQQIKISGKTLKEWGVETVDPVEFHKMNGVKEIGAFRRALGLAPATKVLAVDDDHHNFFDTTKRDAVFDVPAWSVPVADAHFGGDVVAEIDKHVKVFDRVADRVVAMVAVVESSPSGAICDWSTLLGPNHP